MDFIDFYNQKSIETIKSQYKSLVNRCDKYMSLHPDAKLWIRDSDHMYCSIRLEYRNVPDEDYKKLTSTCGMCGSDYHVNMITEDVMINICEYCYAYSEVFDWERMKMLLRYLEKVDSEDQQENKSKIKFDLLLAHLGLKKRIKPNKNRLKSEKKWLNQSSLENIQKANKFRIRVLTPQKSLLYLTLDRIRMDVNERLYLEKDGKKENVIFAGIYLKTRDKNNQRIYQGDIVRFKIKNTDTIWEGVASRKEGAGKYPFWVEDNLNSNFPPEPRMINFQSMEVIGNIFENPDYKVFGGDEAKYYANLIKGMEKSI